MPARMQRLDTGALVLIATCEDCGKPANFGEDVNMRQAIEAFEAGSAKDDPSRWFCAWRDGRPVCGSRVDALDLALEGMPS